MWKFKIPRPRSACFIFVMGMERSLNSNPLMTRNLKKEFLVGIAPRVHKCSFDV